MVDVNLFTSGTPTEKPWLNLVSNSLNTNTVTANTLNVTTTLSSLPLQTSPANLYSTSPNTLAASDLPGGVGTYVANGAQAVQLPTAAQLNTLFAATELEVKSFHFVYNINVRSGAGNLTATFGTGAIGYDSSTSVTVVAGNKNQIFYSWNATASPQWVVYF